MRQRGRKSAANLTVLQVDGAPYRVQAPPGLIKAERVLFDQIVGACSPKHFTESDASLLVTYCQAVLQARRAARNPKAFHIWEKCAKLQATLAVRLRLSPSTRHDPKLVGRAATRAANFENGRPPWDERTGA
jgi:hypothetical protein